MKVKHLLQSLDDAIDQITQFQSCEFFGNPQQQTTFTSDVSFKILKPTNFR